MPDGGKNPLQWSIETWVLAVGMGIMGGVVNNYSRYRREKVFSWCFVVECIIDAIVSGFVSLMVFMAMQSFEQPLGFSAAVGGIVGHRAARLILFTERVTELEIQKIEQNIQKDIDEDATDK